MSYKSYSASERRGILAIALVAMLITFGGIWLSFRNEKPSTSKPDIEVMSDMIDSAHLESSKSISDKKTEKKKRTDIKKSVNKKQKKYRRRSPLDEPV